MRLWPRRHGTSLDLLVVGLGNPGREYARNRHNVGFMVADELARRHGGSFRGKFSGELAELRVDGSRIGLLKPQTYMNNSGVPIAAAARFFKVEPADLLVVHDESDLETGRIQARLGGGLAGHNGVGRPERGDRRPLADYVLSDFPAEDDVEAIVSRATDAVECLLEHGLDETQRRYNPTA
jgi:PTH1 family peptidyl-tRNA hydrolase